MASEQVMPPPVAKLKPPTRSTAPHHPSSTNKTLGIIANTLSPRDITPPAAKRRKLGAIGSQTTLDRFAVKYSHPLGAVESHNPIRDGPNGAVSLTVPIETLSKATPPKITDKRTLRSQDEGPRLKSELAIYFPNYEDVILDIPQKPEFITVDSAIYITDDLAKQAGETTSPVKQKPNGSVNGTNPPATPRRKSSVSFNHSPRESLRMIARTLPEHLADPLTDEEYFKAHRRAERKEKQLRNIERERAMHEKVQLERILDGLRGHDWLKVLGLTGITDGESRKYEEKRDYFIAEVRALVDKFKEWKEEEKKQRLHREEAAAAARDAESVEPASEQSSVEPSSSELNASASQQLHLETVNALKKVPRLKLGLGKNKGGGTAISTPPRPPPKPPSPLLPITSFYAKKHLRDAALGKARHGRNATAFGLPIPDMADGEFRLPREYFDEDFLRANARERRRRKRESTTNANPNT